jgi:hypothetical protein
MLKKSPKTKNRVVQKISIAENTQKQNETKNEPLKTSRIPELGGDMDTYASRALRGIEVRKTLLAQMSDEKKDVDKDQNQRILKSRAMVGSAWYDVAPVIKGNVQMQLSASLFGANLNVPINVNFNIVSIGKGIPLFGMRIPNLRLEARLHRSLQEDIGRVQPEVYTWWSGLQNIEKILPIGHSMVELLTVRACSLKEVLTNHLEYSVSACVRDPVFVSKWNSIAKNTSLAINSFDPHDLEPTWVKNQCERYANAIVTFYLMMEAARTNDLSIENLHCLGFDLQVTDDCDKTMEILDNVTMKAINILSGRSFGGTGLILEIPKASILQYFVPEYSAMIWWSNMMGGVEFSGFEVLRLLSEIEIRRLDPVDANHSQVNSYHTLHSKIDGVDNVVIPKSAEEFEMNLKTVDEKISRRQVDDPHCFVRYVEIIDHCDEDIKYVARYPNHIAVSPTIMVHGTQTTVVGKTGLGLHIREHLSPVCSVMTSAVIRNGCLHIEYGEGPVRAGYMQSDMVSMYQTLIPKIFSDTFDRLKPNPIGGWTFNSQYGEWHPKTGTIAKSGQNYVYTSDMPSPVYIDVESKCAHVFPMLLDPTFASRVISLYMEWYNKLINGKIPVVVDNEVLAIEDVIAKSEKGKYYSCSRMLLLAVILNCSNGMINFGNADDIGSDPCDSAQQIKLFTDGTALWVKD